MLQLRQLLTVSLRRSVRMVRAHKSLRTPKHGRDCRLRRRRRVEVSDAAAGGMPQLLELHQLRALRGRQLLRVVGGRGEMRAARARRRRRGRRRRLPRALPPAPRLRALPRRARPLRLVRGHPPVFQLQRLYQRVPVRPVSRVARQSLHSRGRRCQKIGPV